MRHAWLLPVLPILLILPTGAASADEPARKPVPDAKAQKEALALVRDLFKAEYAAKALDKRAEFARTLLKQGIETESDAAAQFVLLREAADVAAAAGEVETALKALGESASRFPVDEPERAGVLAKLIMTAKPGDPQKAVAEEALSLAERALGADDFERAAAHAALAEKAAFKSKDVPVIAAVRKRKEDIASAKTKFARVAKSAETLRQKPDDPEANLEMGRYACFVKGDWESGLPRLAKGGDAVLQALAAKSLQKTEEARLQTEIAGGWWDQAEKLTGAERDTVRRYSADRYREALPNLTGLAKTLAERRIADAARSGATGRVARTVDLVLLLDVTKDVIHGVWKTDRSVLRCETGNFIPKVQFPYQPPDEYDYVVVFSQPRLRNGINFIMPNRRGGSFHWVVGGGNGAEHHLSVAGANMQRIPMGGAVRTGAVHTATVQVRRDSVKVILDGRVLLQHKTDFKDLETDNWREIKDKTLLGLGCDDPTVFQSVKVIEVSGPGKRVR